MAETRPPKVFISYAWEDDIKAWVLDFATRLRSDGINAILDQWETVPGDQLPEFMEKSVRESDFVVFVCTPTYKRKSDRRKGGVGYEGHIITGEVFQKNNHRKFIPVLRKGKWASAAPSWATSKLFIDFRDIPYSEASYQQLLNTLFGKSPTAPPILDDTLREIAKREAAEKVAREKAERDAAEKVAPEKAKRESTHKVMLRKIDQILKEFSLGISQIILSNVFSMLKWILTSIIMLYISFAIVRFAFNNDHPSYYRNYSPIDLVTNFPYYRIYCLIGLLTSFFQWLIFRDRIGFLSFVINSIAAAVLWWMFNRRILPYTYLDVTLWLWSISLIVYRFPFMLNKSRIRA